jgi:hypothetical protein
MPAMPTMLTMLDIHSNTYIPTLSTTINIHSALPVKEELVVSAVLKIVSLVRMAVYAAKMPLSVFEQSFNLNLLLTQVLTLPSNC